MEPDCTQVKSPVNVDAVLALAMNGWPVHPIRGKIPVLNDWPQKATTDHERISRWWTNGYAGYNVGIVCGTKSGLVIIDIDPRNDGNISLFQLEAKYGPLPRETIRVRTPSGGEHIYLAHPGGKFVVKSLTSLMGFPGIDVRGDGGQVAAPPSVGANGHKYDWISEHSALAQIPPRWLPLLSSLSRTNRQKTQRHRDTQYCSLCHAPRSLCHERIEEAIVGALPNGRGQRNSRIFALARGLKAIHPEAAFGDLRPIVRNWHIRARSVIQTKEFEDSWADFVYAWPRVKHPTGKGLIQRVSERARRCALPQEAASYRQAELRNLVSLCRELQREAGDQPYFLASRTAGEAIGVSWKTACRWLGMLVADGVIAVVESHGARRATRYRYLCDTGKVE
ncbi:MAG: bifunctional DNA primase/polymerase [Planctomycetes bacterium]|nr:bifunctional DNA primase/polymerase [Planctomycetota bacterium]